MRAVLASGCRPYSAGVGWKATGRMAVTLPGPARASTADRSELDHNRVAVPAAKGAQQGAAGRVRAGGWKRNRLTISSRTASRPAGTVFH
jgi:hypothetical protein